MSQHVAVTVATGVPVYFCDPSTPWQRGSNARLCEDLGTLLAANRIFDEVNALVRDQPRTTSPETPWFPCGQPESIGNHSRAYFVIRGGLSRRIPTLEGVDPASSHGSIRVL